MSKISTLLQKLTSLYKTQLPHRQAKRTTPYTNPTPTTVDNINTLPSLHLSNHHTLARRNHAQDQTYNGESLSQCALFNPSPKQLQNRRVLKTQIELTIRGGKRVYGEGEKRTKLPLTADNLQNIIQHIQIDWDGINLKAAFCVAFAGFLRSGEFTWNTWEPLSLWKSQLTKEHGSFNVNGSVTLTPPTSKTDQYRKGTNIHLSPSNTSLCPVKALSILSQYHPSSPMNPLFSRMYGPFNKSYFVDKMKELLLHAGISSAHISGHSIRKEDIKLRGRWKSDAVDMYTKKTLRINSPLHLIKPPIPINTTHFTLPWHQRHEPLPRIALAPRKQGSETQQQTTAKLATATPVVDVRSSKRARNPRGCHH